MRWARREIIHKYVTELNTGWYQTSRDCLIHWLNHISRQFIQGWERSKGIHCLLYPHWSDVHPSTLTTHRIMHAWAPNGSQSISCSRVSRDALGCSGVPWASWGRRGDTYVQAWAEALWVVLRWGQMSPYLNIVRVEYMAEDSRDR